MRSGPCATPRRRRSNASKRCSRTSRADSSRPRRSCASTNRSPSTSRCPRCRGRRRCAGRWSARTAARKRGRSPCATRRSSPPIIGPRRPTIRGASYVGINPLHAPFRTDPEAASPYAASSRVWLNWLSIALDDVPEYDRSPAQTAISDEGRIASLAALRAAADVEYTGVAAYKDAVLRACFSALDDDPVRHAAFEAWCTAQGPPLARFAVFESLAARFGRELGDWPATFRNPASADVALFAAGENDEIAFAMYLQWLAAEQLAAVAQDAARHGVRLYRDLAVGVDANAAHT